MPIIKSAKKRVRVAKKAAVRNHKTKRSLKSAIKTFEKNLGTAKAASSLSSAQSKIGQAAKKHVIHKNKAARQQKQLAARAKAAGVKTVKSTPKKAVVKKATKPKNATKKS